MPGFYNYNGKNLGQGENFISPDNRAFRYGDGLFETMVLRDGVLRLAHLHFERLFDGLTLMKFDVPKLFTASHLKQEIISLCKKNKLTDVRIRLAVFRGDGGLYDSVNLHPNYVIQCWALQENTKQFNENGLVIDIYPEAKKAVDIFSNIKSANYLLYAMAALHAKENKLNDCLVLNTEERIADSTIANLFYIKEGVLFTPPLKEGCIAGVMRRYLIENAAAIGYSIKEKPVFDEDLISANEVFLTNATYGIRWVKQFRQKEYENSQTQKIYNQLMNMLNNPV
ncbi:MAG: aminotransferase class IV [Sphingobacteriales bacterium]|nr:aminotransferase class IV [Sphingobacteriales bacterium]